MPANGGAFFGFAIIVAAALVTWGIIALVNVASDNNDDSGDDYASAREADSDIQAALNDASPGDTIFIPQGINYVSLTTAVDGTEDEPITITCQDGVSRDDCILRGDDRSRVLEILHSWYIIEGFTIDGEETTSEYREQLIYVEGSSDPTSVDGVETSLTGVEIRGMTIKNAAKECVRIRYFVTDTIVQANEIGPCGIEDFELGSDGSNGEGVYIGTALNQIDDKNGDNVLDVCTGIVVMGNAIDTQGSEGVDIKEGSYGNIVYNNEIRGQMDEETGGISLRGDDNYVFSNHIIDGQGACVRIGGHDYDGTDYGKNNEVYDNILDGCEHSAVKVNESPQIICDNTVIAADDPNDDDLYAAVRGDAADEFTSITGDCPSLTSVALPAVYVPDDDITAADDDDTPTDDDQVEEDDDETSNTVYVVADDDNGNVDDDDSDLQEEDDDTSAAADPSNTYSYVGCYYDNPSNSVLDNLVIEDDPNLSVNNCIAACVDNSKVYAAIKEGNDCWCSNSGEVNDYGVGVCNLPCSGSGEDDCGGESAFSLYEIVGDGGVTFTDDSGDDDGATGGDEAGDGSTSSCHSVDDDDDAPATTSGSVVVVSTTDDDAAGTVADDDDNADVGDDAIVTTGVYVGCFKDNDNSPILEDFMYEDEDDLTPAVCIESCREADRDLAGLQNKAQCWCGDGTTDDIDTYGPGDCNLPCSGNAQFTCGGEGSASVWTVG